MRNNILLLVAMAPRNVNKASRIYFHRVVKENRFTTLQERRFNLKGKSSEEQVIDQWIKALLEGTRISLQ